MTDADLAKRIDVGLDVVERMRGAGLICREAGCGGRVGARGWCQGHYMRARRIERGTLPAEAMKEPVRGYQR